MQGRALVAIEPTAPAAADAARRWRQHDPTLFGRPLAAWRRETRLALGLPTQAPVVVTGHQAQIWHAGILAKWFAADTVASAMQGTAAQLVVDEDVNDPGHIEYPAEVEGRLAVVRLPIEGGRRSGPTGLEPPMTPLPPVVPPLPEAREGLDRIAAALRRASDAGSAAAQLSRANDALLGTLVHPMTTLFATKLLATPLGSALVGAMTSAGGECVAAYNQALSRDPHLARPLAPGELPLWRLRPEGRERVMVGPPAPPAGDLAPRAFLMTAFVRLAVADLFVHGTGGARYERVTEAWIRDWLGIDLAPMVVATATTRLPLERYLGEGPMATPEDLRRLQWDPDAGGGNGPSEGKRQWLERIAVLPPRSDRRRAAYRGLREHLATRAEAHRGTLEILARLVAESRQRTKTAAIARSRTWPWALHTQRAIIDLRDAVQQTFSG